jgi:hypothetical protein
MKYKVWVVGFTIDSREEVLGKTKKREEIIIKISH